MFGPSANSPQHLATGGGLLEALSGIGLQGLDAAKSFATWVEALGEAAKEPFLLDLDPPWLGGASRTVQLELTKTSVEHHWIILSVPRTPIPKVPPPPVAATFNSIRRPASQSFSLGELPSRPQWDLLSPHSSPTTPSISFGNAPAPPGHGEGGLFTAQSKVRQTRCEERDRLRSFQCSITLSPRC